MIRNLAFTPNVGNTKSHLFLPTGSCPFLGSYNGQSCPQSYCNVDVLWFRQARDRTTWISVWKMESPFGVKVLEILGFYIETNLRDKTALGLGLDRRINENQVAVGMLNWFAAVGLDDMRLSQLSILPYWWYFSHDFALSNHGMFGNYLGVWWFFVIPHYQIHH